MSATDDLRELSQARSFVLEVAGLVTRYYGGADGVAPPAKEYAAGLEYEDVEAITHVGRSDNRLASVGGLAEHGPIRIALATYGAEATGSDPGVVFGRLGVRSASTRALLVTTLEQDDSGPAAVEIDRDLSGLAYPRLFHIGAETFRATGFAGDGTAGNRYRFTGVTRGYAASRVQRHDANEETGEQPPVVTPEVVYWRGRRATLYVGSNPDPAGTFATEYVELMRGFLEASPTVSADGLSVSLDLVPLTASLDQATAAPKAAQRVSLLSGWHYFTRGRASTAVVSQWIAPRREIATVAGAAAVNDGEVEVDDTDTHGACFDVDLAEGHPRSGMLWRGQLLHPTAYLAGPTRFDLPADEPTGALNIGNRLSVYRAGEAFLVDLLDGAAAGLLRWPADGLDALNARWAPGSKDNADGAWCDVRVEADRLTIASNCADLADDPGFQVEVWSDDHGGALDWTVDPPRSGALTWLEHLTFGFDLRVPEAIGRGVARRRLTTWSLQFDPEVFVEEVPIIGPPDGFYQAGEEYVLVDGDPGTIPAGGLPMRVTYYDRDTDEELTQDIVITSSTATFDGAGNTIGYRLSLSDPMAVFSFGNWTGEAVAELAPRVAFHNERPATVLLKLLMSGGGNGVNGAYDTLPIGASLTADDVDVRSFLRIGTPPGFERWSFAVEEGATVREVVDRIGRALQIGLAMRRDAQGRCRLTAFPVGPENEIEAVDAIAAGEWADEPVPSWGDDDEITNRLEVTLNYALLDDEPRLTVDILDQASINAHFGEVRSEDIELRGVDIPADLPGRVQSVLRPWYSSLFAYSAWPRRLWSGRISTGRAFLGELGAVYTLSSPHLRGYGDTLGVTGQAARVTEIGLELWQEGADLVLTHTGINGSGWNASAQVASVPGPATITVADNAYSSPEHPATGAAQVDLDGFTAGDSVRCVPAGDHDSAVVRVIASIDRATSTVVFTAAHGLAVGDTLEPTTYDTAGASFQPYAYLADGSEALGAGDDEGHDYT